MQPASLVKSVTLEDGASPRSARYMIRLRQLTEGYVVETVWGGRRDRKNSESYFRPTLAAAQEKFEKILASKTAGRRTSRRHYEVAIDSDQLRLLG